MKTLKSIFGGLALIGIIVGIFCTTVAFLTGGLTLSAVFASELTSAQLGVASLILGFFALLPYSVTGRETRDRLNQEMEGRIRAGMH